MGNTIFLYIPIIKFKFIISKNSYLIECQEKFCLIFTKILCIKTCEIEKNI